MEVNNDKLGSLAPCDFIAMRGSNESAPAQSFRDCLQASDASKPVDLPHSSNPFRLPDLAGELMPIAAASMPTSPAPDFLLNVEVIQTSTEEPDVTPLAEASEQEPEAEAPIFASEPLVPAPLPLQLQLVSDENSKPPAVDAAIVVSADSSAESAVPPNAEPVSAQVSEALQKGASAMPATELPGAAGPQPDAATLSEELAGSISSRSVPVIGHAATQVTGTAEPAADSTDESVHDQSTEAWAPPEEQIGSNGVLVSPETTPIRRSAFDGIPPTTSRRNSSSVSASQPQPAESGFDLAIHAADPTIAANGDAIVHMKGRGVVDSPDETEAKASDDHATSPPPATTTPGNIDDDVVASAGAGVPGEHPDDGAPALAHASPTEAPAAPMPGAAKLPAVFLKTKSGSPEESGRSAEIDPAKFLHRVVKAFESAQRRDSEVRLRLHPAELGALSIEVKVQDGVLTAHVQAETSEAKAAIVDNLPALRERLAEQGIRIDKFDVDLMDHSDRRQQSLDEQARQQAARESATSHGGSRRAVVAEQAPVSAPRSRSSGQGGLNVVI